MNAFLDRPRPVHLDPDRPVLDRRFKRITYEKKQKLMNVVLLHREQLVCLFVCLSPKLAPKTGLETGLEMWRKKVRPSPVKCPSMSSDYRNKQYQDGNKMCEKSSAFDRIRDKTDSNMKVCRFVTQQDLANQIL